MDRNHHHKAWITIKYSVNVVFMHAQHTHYNEEVQWPTMQRTEMMRKHNILLLQLAT